MNIVPIRETIRIAWDTFKNHWGILWGALVVALVINAVFDVAGRVLDKESLLISLGIGALGMVVSVVVQLGIYRIALDVIQGKSPVLEQLFSEQAKALRFFGASVLYAGIVLGGLILLIVPGIMWGIKFSYYGYAILDRNLDIMESLRFSAKITEGQKWNIFKLYLVFGVLFLVSIVPLLVGWVATVPMGVVLGAIVYTKLVAAHEPAAAPAPGEEVGADITPPAPAPFVPLGE
jgi:hypothetical protein